MDIQKHPRESQETLPDSFLQNHNLVSSFTCRPWFNSNGQQFLFQVRVAWTCCRSTSWWLHVASNQGRLLKPQALLNFSKFFFFVIPLGISFISCSYSQPPHWLTVNDYFPFCLQPFTAYFYIQRYSIGDVFRIEIKTMVFCCPKHCGSQLWLHVIIGYSHFGGLKSPKKLFF